jgi:hypothetical protein
VGAPPSATPVHGGAWRKFGARGTRVQMDVPCRWPLSGFNFLAFFVYLQEALWLFDYFMEKYPEPLLAADT